jgi:hypothetical protein
MASCQAASLNLAIRQWALGQMLNLASGNREALCGAKVPVTLNCELSHGAAGRLTQAVKYATIPAALVFSSLIESF